MYTALYLLAAVSLASAHTRFVQLDSSTTKNAEGFGVRETTTDSPLSDVTKDSMACNENTKASSSVIPVVAGTSMTAHLVHGGEGVIASSHVGPVMAYLKKVTDATTDSGIGDGWFKIQEDGYDPTTEKWGVDRLRAAGSQSITIPSCIEDGQYLLRTELIALHGASTALGAQFYGGCGQISVTGGTSIKTPSTVAFPGAYSQTDPGILVQIYWPKLTNYTIPGPAVFTCDGSSGSSSGNSGSSDKGSDTYASTPAKQSAPPAYGEADAVPTTMKTSTRPAPTSTEKAGMANLPAEEGVEEEYPSAAATTTTSKPAAVAAPTSAPTKPASYDSSDSTTSSSAAAAVPEMPAGTTMKDLLKWLSDMIDGMLKA